MNWSNCFQKERCETSMWSCCWWWWCWIKKVIDFNYLINLYNLTVDIRMRMQLNAGVVCTCGRLCVCVEEGGRGRRGEMERVDVFLYKQSRLLGNHHCLRMSLFWLCYIVFPKSFERDLRTFHYKLLEMIFVLAIQSIWVRWALVNGFQLGIISVLYNLTFIFIFHK